jgi:molybdopterin-guanine dinucleotide biosynthesis protein A
MGADKAVLTVGGRTLLARAAAELAKLCDAVVLASGERPRYGELGLTRVLDRRADGGPLAGLEAGLFHAAERARDSGADGAWVAALACDMPRVPGELFGALLARALAARADVALASSAAGLEPLAALYNTRALPAVTRALDAGERKMTSFHRGFGPVEVLVVREAELASILAGADFARNVNTPADWQVEGLGG